MFYYSLPIIFIDIRWITPGESFIAFCTTLAALFFTVPAPAIPPISANGDNYLLNAWLGNIRLGLVFWPFFLVLNASLVVADLLAKNGKLTVSSWDDIYFVLIFPYIWWLVSVWRCSANTSMAIWAAIARMGTLLVLVEYVLKLIIRINYPRLFFNCEDLLMNYGNCF